MTLVIELEQCFESVAQVDRRAHSSWSSLSNEWRWRKMKRVNRWPKKKRASEDGRTATSLYKSAEARDFPKPQAMMTTLDALTAFATEASLDVTSDQI